MPGSAGNTLPKDAVSLKEARAAIENFTTSIEKRLKPGLNEACQQRDKAMGGLAELEQMEKALDVLDMADEAAKGIKGKLDVSGRPLPALETRVNIGEEFYMKGHVHCLDRVIVDVGLGVRVELSRRQARGFVNDRRHMLQVRVDRHTKRIAEVQAILNNVMENVSKVEMAAYGAEVRENHGVGEDDY